MADVQTEASVTDEPLSSTENQDIILSYSINENEMKILYRNLVEALVKVVRVTKPKSCCIVTTESVPVHTSGS